MRFVWDPIKALLNKKKHGVVFDEAVTVFLDPNALRIFDTEHSNQEDRWVLLGLSRKTRLMVVAHLFKEQDVIRIISARKASKAEVHIYQEKLK